MTITASGVQTQPTATGLRRAAAAAATSATGTSGTSGTTATTGRTSSAGTTGSTGTGSTQGTAARNGATVRTENGSPRIELNQTFDNFLTLLTTQLKNQDPVSPMDTNQFTSQLVQFTQVEQQMKGNDQLQRLIQLQQASQISYAASLTGKEVQIEGDSGALGDTGSIEFGYTMPRGAATATVNILDARGAVVFSREGEAAAGRHPFVWDGKGSSGQRAPAGTYRIQVVAKTDQEQPVEVKTSVVRTVAGVQLENGSVTLDVGGSTMVPLDRVQTIREERQAA